MAQVKTPLYDSFFLNEPALIQEVLEKRPQDFPKSDLIGSTLAPLLGSSIFVTNGDTWARQRRIVDPAFEKGRLRTSFMSMRSAGDAALDRLGQGDIEAEFEMSFLAADVIFRSLFSIPITDKDAEQVFHSFREFQRSQPILSFTDLLRLPRWFPRYRRGASHAKRIREILGELVAKRQKLIDQGDAPDDLATKIMTTKDPETGHGFSSAEMIDQVAIFFLAGHETSASALAWSLYCLARDQDAQQKIVQELESVVGSREIEFSDVPKLRFSRDVFREVLRLYPPVPMMVRQSVKSENFRDQHVAPGSLCLISPWHLQRNERIWENPDVFDPWRWQDERTHECARDAYIPFSKGVRVCTGAGFAMVEGVLLLAMLVRKFEFHPKGAEPVPVAHLTVRAENGIQLTIRDRTSI